MEIDRLNELFPWRLPAGDYETIAGLVVTQLGRVPRPGVRVKLAARHDRGDPRRRARGARR